MAFQPKVFVCDTAEELSAVACNKVLEIINTAGRDAWPLAIALSGGSTPKKLYTRLHDEHLKLLKDERALKFFFGDERLVAKDSADLNYKMAKEALLCDIPDDLVVPVDTECAVDLAQLSSYESAIKAAEEYEKRIGLFIPFQPVAGASGKYVPVFDIILLGIGADGHTASIFPDSQAEGEMQRAVSVAFPSPTMNPQVWRVTLTPLTIMHARYVIVLATGKEKKWVLDNILAESPTKTPVSRFLRSCKGELIFIIDKAMV